MAEPVRVRRLTDQEGQKLQQIVRRYLRRVRGRSIRSGKGIRWGGQPVVTAA